MICLIILDKKIKRSTHFTWRHFFKYYRYQNTGIEQHNEWHCIKLHISSCLRFYLWFSHKTSIWIHWERFLWNQKFWNIKIFVLFMLFILYKIIVLFLKWALVHKSDSVSCVMAFGFAIPRIFHDCAPKPQCSPLNLLQLWKQEHLLHMLSKGRLLFRKEKESCSWFSLGWDAVICSVFLSMIGKD